MLSILLPTKNRSESLIGRLLFYNSLSFKGEILIGDSSNQIHINKTLSFINSKKLNIKINHFKMPNLSESRTTKKLIEFSNFNYGVWSGDDDFHIPATLYQCVNFLEKNNNYVSVNGKSFALVIDNRKIIYSWIYKLPQFSGKNVEERFKKAKINFGDTHYSVHRIDVLKKIYNDVEYINDHFLAASTKPVLSSIVSGNMAQLDELSLIRTIDKNRPKNNIDYLLKLNDPDWLKDRIKLIEVISNQIVEKDDLSIEKANEILYDYLIEETANSLSKNNKVIDKISKRKGISPLDLLIFNFFKKIKRKLEKKINLNEEYLLKLHNRFKKELLIAFNIIKTFPDELDL